MSYFLLLSAGAFVGALITYLICRAALARADERFSNISVQTAKDQQQRESLSTELTVERSRAETLNMELGRMTTTVNKERESFQAQIALLQSAEQRLKDSFGALAADALRGNSTEFMQLAQKTLEAQQQRGSGDLDLRKQAVESLVKPISETLTKLEGEIKNLENKREGAYGEITTQINSLSGSQQELKKETSRLVSALKTTKDGGGWGQMQLKRVVELAGMIEYCDFNEQQSYDTEQGKLRPDMVVHLPNGKEIVVDAKVSVAAYLDANATEDDDQRTAKLKDHARHVRAHIDRLSDKAYWKHLANTPEFVIAFLPLESLYGAALQEDPSIIEYGPEHGVLLATPTTLIALLKAVHLGWRHEQLAENAAEIKRLGAVLHERLSDMTGHLVDLKESIDGSVTAFNKAVGTLETRVLVAARKFRTLGAAGGEAIQVIEPIESMTRELRERMESPVVPRSEARIKRIAAAAGDGDDT